MKEIELSQNQVALVDDDMYEELNQFKWFADKSRSTFYAKRHLPTINGRRPFIRMHHVIAGKPPRGFVSDHRDGNGLNNLKSNLRHVTNRQNCQNLKNIKKTSKYPGVGWHKKSQKWRAYIKINNKAKSLGFFTDEAEAFEAYKRAVENLGEKVIAGI